MMMLWITWPIFAALILVVYLWLGKATTKNRGSDDYTGSVLGILIDDRGRYSLTRLQLSLWTLVVLSLIAGVVAARAMARGIDLLDFSIPPQVLGLLGISVGSAAIATAVKSQKNRTRSLFVAASMPGAATPAQMLMVEEGPQADKTVDVTKLQNFLLTVFLAGAYVVLAIHTYAGSGPGTPVSSPADITSLPAFSGTFLALLAISHAGYLGAKIPNRGQDPQLDQPEMPLVRANAMQMAHRGETRPPGGKAAAARTAETARIRDEVLGTAGPRDGGGVTGPAGTPAPPQHVAAATPAGSGRTGG